MRTQLPLAICFTMGVLMLGQYFVPHAASQDLFRRTQEWLQAIGVFALVLGLGSLIHLHWERIRRQSANWRYSVVVLSGLVVMAGVGLVQGNLQPARKLTPTSTRQHEDGTYTFKDTTITLRSPTLAGRTLLRGDQVHIVLADGSTAAGKIGAKVADGDDGDDGDGRLTAQVVRWKGGTPPDAGTGFAVVRPGADLFSWLFKYVQTPLDATMFSLLAFFIASAAFRAFRARNLEATLMLVAACAVILGLTPPFVHAWNTLAPAMPGFPTALKDWILDVPNMASRRAIVLGIGLGAIAQSFRIILGLERTYLGGAD
ncbi:hypothetical protein CMK11_01085 [Candidatus Poribacteria bacterium]|jgi:hypothetical protein|nr:hypothetical protein [Candidatus Poribacteria bacterium]